VLTQFHPEGQYQIQDNGGAKSHECGVNEIPADGTWWEFQFLPNPRANTEYLILHKIPESIHVLFENNCLIISNFRRNKQKSGGNLLNGIETANYR
jgi:hypothetical protein